MLLNCTFVDACTYAECEFRPVHRRFIPFPVECDPVEPALNLPPLPREAGVEEPQLLDQEAPRVIVEEELDRSTVSPSTNR